MTTTVYRARRILTMHPARPEATHVAVRDGRILGVGTLEELRGWGPHALDERFADKVLMPGLVEGHSHLMAGSLWRHTYCGYFPVRDPAGREVAGSPTLDAVVAALSVAAGSSVAATGAGADNAGGPVLGWGFDPIYFGSRRCARGDLDRVSRSRPVGLLHASGHILNVNSVALERSGLLRPGIDHPGIPLGADGLPTGELKGPDAMGAAFAAVGLSRSFLSADEAGVRAFGRLAVRAGVTTATDLAASLGDEELDTLLRLTGEDDYPVSVVPLLRLIGMTPEAAVQRAVALRGRSTERLRLGRIKVVADGSIQGFSARLRWPGYYNGAPNGLWYTAPETIREAYALALQHGVQIHTHTNGDEATDLALDCLQAALQHQPAPDHRFVLQHCQLADDAQFVRMKALGMGVNLFANHHFYWGDQHRETTVGPERAERMNACRSALTHGVPCSIHSDAPITPLGPLFTAWCAVNRLTASGRVLGGHQRIGVMEALHAVTLGAAWTLKLDGEVGSIECGKRADFCVLEDDPLEMPPEQLKDVRVWGTVQGGRVFSAQAMTVPAVVIGGYLGAGKTTLVNHLLRHAQGRRIAVLVNDFGEVSIDADLIVGAEGDVLALAGGCVCCSFGNDLVGTLVQITSRDPAPDVLLVETSGVGLPAAVARAVRLAPGVTVDGIVVVADASALPERAQDRYVGDVVRQQLEEADLLVLNRTDQATPAGLAASRACVAQHAARARVIEAVRGAIPPDALLGPQAWAAAAPCAETSPADAGVFASAGFHAEGRAALRPPALATAADRFEAGLELHDVPVSLDDLCRRLQADARLVRAKGLVQANDGAWHVVQAVGARVETAPWTGDAGAPEPTQAPGARAGRLAWIRLRA